MKIVILGTAYPYRGGLAAYNERLCRQLLAEGHSVRVETFTLQYPDFLFPGKTQYSDATAPTDMSIVRTVHSMNPFNWLRVGYRLRKECPDKVIIKFWHPYLAPCLGSIARIIRGNGHTQVVSVLDNVIPHERKWTDRLLVRYFVRSVDAFVAMSQSVLDDLSLFDSQKPRALCPHPLYDNFGQPVSKEEAATVLGLSPSVRYLLFFGFIRDYKGLDILLRAWNLVRAGRTDVRLLVAGEFYNNAEQYYQLEQTLGLQGTVEWRTDFIPDDQVRYYFSLADLIVQPYKSATQSGVTQIAYHFLKPMLVTNVGGLSELVPAGKVGYVTEATPESVAEALQDFLQQHQVDDFRKGLEEERAKYAWSRMTETIIQLA